MPDTTITSVNGRRVWDSRGRPTVEAEVRLACGALGRAIAPAGASRGSREAIDLRDGGDALGGMDVRLRRGARHRRSSRSASAASTPRIRTKSTAALIALDGTPNKARLGGNATIAVSMACLHATAAAHGEPLWRYLAQGAAGALAAARDPDLRRRRARRPPHRHPGLDGHGAVRDELRRGACA